MSQFRQHTPRFCISRIHNRILQENVRTTTPNGWTTRRIPNSKVCPRNAIYFKARITTQIFHFKIWNSWIKISKLNIYAWISMICIILQSVLLYFGVSWYQEYCRRNLLTRKWTTYLFHNAWLWTICVVIRALK